MDIERCYKILELDPDSSLAEVRQAYRDSVSIWHPDRFGGSNPRLIRKAEGKLKEINEAYETLVSSLSGLGKTGRRKDEQSASGASGENRQPPLGKNRMNPESAFSSRTEAVAEAGTRILLTASSQLMKMFRRWIDADGA
jgi:curved DNA-binding protein CbpA